MVNDCSGEICWLTDSWVDHLGDLKVGRVLWFHRDRLHYQRL